MTVRVLHVLVPEPEGSVGGADAHVRDLAAAQLNSGTSSPVVFATLSPSFARQVRATGVECRSTAGAGARAVLPTLRALLRERADVVHSHGYDATWWTVAALATLRRPPPLVVTCHGWIETSPKLRVMSALDRLANRSAAGIVLVSEELVPVALRHAARARAIAVVPNGVPIRPLRDRGDARCALGLPSDRLVVAAMGRLTTEKNVMADIEVRTEVEFLMDESDSFAAGLPGAGEGHRRTPKGDSALIGRNDASEDLHQLGIVPMERPSRRTEIRSPTRCNSSNRCEMYTNPIPLSCKVFMREKSRSISFVERLAVGSSMMRIFDS